MVKVLKWSPGGAGPFTGALRATVAVSAAICLSVWCAVPAPAGAAVYHVEQELLVVQLASRAEAHAGSELAWVPGPTPVDLPGNRWLLNVPSGEAAYVQSRLSAESGVNYVAPDEPVREAGLPDNPCYSATCGPAQPVVVENPSAGSGATLAHPDGEPDLWAVNASQAWGYTEGNPNLLVAVLDTGVSTENAQLQGKVVQGPDVCADDDELCQSPNDNNGHGTFVAGLIAAANNDGMGMASLGWNVKVLSIKILDDQGEGGTADEATGIYDAVDLGAKVINLSTSDYPCNLYATFCGPNPDVQAAVQYALAQGVVVVAAAGNWDEDEPVYPASYPGVLSVAGATDEGSVDPPNGGPYLDFSEYGDAANIAAPGVDILSTWNDGNYAVESGTSYAVPLVSAAAALVLSVDPDLSAAQVATLLRSTASPLAEGSAAIDGGFLNVGAAVEDAYNHDLPSALDGYQLALANGAVLSAGTALGEGSMAGRPLASPVVGMAATPNGGGYWLVAKDGGVFSFGDARFYGSAAGLKLKQPIVGMAATPNGGGYWLVAKDGGVFSFGDARFYGSAAGLKLKQPIVGMAATPNGGGYWLVAKDGGVFSFGGAHYWGSAEAEHPKGAIVGMAAPADGGGYWLVGDDGGVYAFGDARDYGSDAGVKLAQPVVGLAASPNGTGYWMATAGGQVFNFGSATYEVPSFSHGPGAPVVGIAS